MTNGFGEVSCLFRGPSLPSLFDHHDQSSSMIIDGMNVDAGLHQMFEFQTQRMELKLAHEEGVIPKTLKLRLHLTASPCVDLGARSKFLVRQKVHPSDPTSRASSGHVAGWIALRLCHRPRA